MVELVNNSLFTWQQSDPIVLSAAKHRHTVQYSRTWCDTLSARLDFRSIPLKRRKTKYAHVKNVDGSRLLPQQSVCLCRWPDHGYNHFCMSHISSFPLNFCAVISIYVRNSSVMVFKGCTTSSVIESILQIEFPFTVCFRFPSLEILYSHIWTYIKYK